MKAASTELRIKAIATVSAVDVGALFRGGWDGTASDADQLATLDAVAQQRTAEAAGAEPAFIPYVPEVGDTTAPHDLPEAADYYLTPRGQHPNAPVRATSNCDFCLMKISCRMMGVENGSQIQAAFG